MKTCTRCSGNLSSAAKAAGSEVCTACASAAGELTSVVLLPLTPFRNSVDWRCILARLNS